MAEKRTGFTPCELDRIERILDVINTNMDEYVTTYDRLAVGHTPVEAVLHLSDKLHSVGLSWDELVRELSVAVRTIHGLRLQLRIADDLREQRKDQP
jgi:hypothetical protein